MICYKCGHSEHLEDADFCQNCGMELLNFCTNSECDTFKLPAEYKAIPRDAKYCPYCGSKSTYFDYLNNLED